MLYFDMKETSLSISYLNVPILVNEHVFWLEGAVHDAPIKHVRESLRHTANIELGMPRLRYAISCTCVNACKEFATVAKFEEKIKLMLISVRVMQL